MIIMTLSVMISGDKLLLVAMIANLSVEACQVVQAIRGRLVIATSRMMQIPSSHLLPSSPLLFAVIAI